MKSGAGFLFFCDNQVLLLHRVDDHTWGNVGGLADPEEAPLETAIRETKEELGSIPPFQIFDKIIFNDPPFFKYTNYLATVQDKTKWHFSLDEEENFEAKWFSLKELPQDLHFGLKYIIEKVPQYFNQINPESNMNIQKVLKTLLKQEYQQRDLYESYAYWLAGTSSLAIQQHLEKHIKEEMEHVQILQRYLMSMGESPSIKRLPIPKVRPLTLENILRADLALEEQAIESYTNAIRMLESSNYIALRVDLENILIVEQEHFHDLQRWLRNDLCEGCKFR